MPRVLRTDLIGLPLTLADSPATSFVERPGGDHGGLTNADRWPGRCSRSPTLKPAAAPDAMKNLSPPPGAYFVLFAWFLGLTPQAKHLSPLRGSYTWTRALMTVADLCL